MECDRSSVHGPKIFPSLTKKIEGIPNISLMYRKWTNNQADSYNSRRCNDPAPLEELTNIPADYNGPYYWHHWHPLTPSHLPHGRQHWLKNNLAGSNKQAGS